MKYLIIFFLTITTVCKGQEVKFRLYLTKFCSTVEQLDTSYYLLSAGQIDQSYSPKNGTVYLPKPGRYYIYFIWGPVLDSTAVDLKDTGLTVFRYKVPKIQLYATGAVDSSPIYVKCDTPVNGYQEDFYPNGQLKMRGNFVNGYRKDSLITFYPTGLVKERIISSHKTVHIENFDSTGNLTKERYHQNKSFMVYREYKLITYFPNRKIRSIESSVNHVQKIKDFYPSGGLRIIQNKKRRIEYFENGLKSVVYWWKYEKTGVSKEKDFTIHKLIYNKDGQITLSATYQNWNNYSYPPTHDVAKSDWIIKIIRYKAGKEIYHVNDMDTAEYLKKYPDDSGNL